MGKLTPTLLELQWVMFIGSWRQFGISIHLIVVEEVFRIFIKVCVKAAISSSWITDEFIAAQVNDQQLDESNQSGNSIFQLKILTFAGKQF